MHTRTGPLKNKQGLQVGNKQKLRAKASVGLSPAAPCLRPFLPSSCLSFTHPSITLDHAHLPTQFF